MQPTSDMLLAKTLRFCSGHAFWIVTGLSTIVSVAAIKNMQENVDIAVNYIRLLAQSVSFSINIEAVESHIRAMYRFRSEGTSGGCLVQPSAPCRPNFQVRSSCSELFQSRFDCLQGQTDCTGSLCSLFAFITTLTVKCFPLMCNQNFCNPT